MSEPTSFKSVAIICGGGPAPGINAVISSVAKIFLKAGYRVIGVHEGYKGIFSDSPQIKSTLIMRIGFSAEEDPH